MERNKVTVHRLKVSLEEFGEIFGLKGDLVFVRISHVEGCVNIETEEVRK